MGRQVIGRSGMLTCTCAANMLAYPVQAITVLCRKLSCVETCVTIMTTVGHSDEQPHLSKEQLLWLHLYWGYRLQAGPTPRNGQDPKLPGEESSGSGAPSIWIVRHATARYTRITAHVQNVVIREVGEWWAACRSAVYKFIRAHQPRAKLESGLTQSDEDGADCNKKKTEGPASTIILLKTDVDTKKGILRLPPTCTKLLHLRGLLDE